MPSTWGIKKSRKDLTGSKLNRKIKQGVRIMLNMSTINRRYFSIKINDMELEVEPPKIKVLRKVVDLSKRFKSGDGSIEELSEAVKLILSKNKTGYKVSDEMIDDLDMDQYLTILTEYFNWLTEVKNSPN